jgi:hypothetical protein
MYGRLATAMTTIVSCMPGAPDGDDGDNEPMWSLKIASSWARLDAACGSHAFAKSEPLITTAVAMLPPQHPMVACTCCVARPRSNNEQIARSLDGPPSLVPLSAFATDIVSKLQANINRAWSESRRFVSRLGHGALTFLASDPPASDRLGELRDKFPKHHDAGFRVVVCRIFDVPPSRILSTLRSPTACASCHRSVQAMRGAFALAGVGMSENAWATDFSDQWAR